MLERKTKRRVLHTRFTVPAREGSALLTSYGKEATVLLCQAGRGLYKAEQHCCWQCLLNPKRLSLASCCFNSFLLQGASDRLAASF